MNESQLKTKALAWLRAQPETWVVKIHGGPMGSAGVPDLLCCVRGAFLAIELKSPTSTGKPTPSQAVVGTRIRAAGGLWLVARSLDEVRDAWDSA